MSNYKSLVTNENIESLRKEIGNLSKETKYKKESNGNFISEKKYYK